MKLTLAQVIEATGARYIDDPALRAQHVSGWSIDSRTIKAGDLFFAIQGEAFDGHEFVHDVLERGAVSAIVSHTPSDVYQPLLRTRNPQKALQDLAAFARQFWGGKVVGVTGSAGKTSTKETIAALLQVKYSTGKTVGNLNNHLGLPLSILRLEEQAEIAVLEMGMNHGGEIRDLAKIARPEVGVVTNIGYAHVEAFDGIEGIAAAKRELIEELEVDGVAVLNADDPLVAGFAKSHKGRSTTFGLSEDAEMRATDVQPAPDGTGFRVRGVRFQTKLTGLHSVSNILAGMSVAGAFGIQVKDLVDAVTELKPAQMRGERRQRNGITILNDSYNSNPEAARSMIDVLMNEPAKRRIAVLGEMRELGHMSEQLHRQVGQYLAEVGVDVAVGICGASVFTLEAAVQHGLGPTNAHYFDDADGAGEFLKNFLEPGDAVLFKGSRATHVERALAKIEV